MSKLEGLKILIVDDEPFVRRTIKAVLRAIDRFDVAEAGDGDVALDLVATFKPDLVLCDIAMPRMGGLQFVSQLRANQDEALRRTLVVILTGRADKPTVLDAARLQVSGFMVKPVSPKLLGAHLQTIFANRVAAPAA
jgi:DNA-binding NarL/FixJ family response regulator